MDFQKKTTPEEFNELVCHISKSFKQYDLVFLGIGTFPIDPYNPNNWKEKYIQFYQKDELEIIHLALSKKNSHSIVYFIDNQYQRITDDESWLYVCSSMNKIIGECGKLKYNRQMSIIIYEKITLVYYPFNIPTDYDSFKILESNAIKAKFYKNPLFWIYNFDDFLANKNRLLYRDIYNDLFKSILLYLSQYNNQLYIMNYALCYGHYFLQVPGSQIPKHETVMNKYYEEFPELLFIIFKLEPEIRKNIFIRIDGKITNEFGILF